jgi:hypothetical protein
MLMVQINERMLMAMAILSDSSNKLLLIHANNKCNNQQINMPNPK